MAKIKCGEPVGLILTYSYRQLIQAWVSLKDLKTKISLDLHQRLKAAEHVMYSKTSLMPCLISAV